jgi:hypothetical protein
MALYGLSNLQQTQANVTTSYNTQIEGHALTGAGTLRRYRIYDYTLSQDGPPNATDCALDWDVSRTSAAGTAAGAGTANPLDGGDVASGLTIGLNHPNGTPPTYAAAGSGLNLDTIGLNQRNTYRWACAPGQEIVIPAVTLNGLGWRCKSATYASTAVASIKYQDQ